MNIKQTVIALSFLIGIGGILVSPVVSAAECGGVKTSIISCPEKGGKDIENTGVWGILVLVINIMTAGIGVLAIAGVVYGSVLYTSAGDSSEKVSKARAVIRNVVIGIIAYALMYSALNFIIPGGLFK
ncbi:hypothetical protein H7X68_03070 [Candidatus Saccharibacteria bacterium]|nr:hypothetical protein [Candidatus Saccharibacteria bacterium]